ncbi:helix-turn-helix domain-containing protein [Streptomyces sp. Act143]|uniref:helix-turn-helix domain-containing protein n=1 Tax=Streptomyces sp. Act143 TaxID=2200760 RepID=UPI0035BEB86D
MKAAEGFASGEPHSVIAKELRVSVRFVPRWRRAWDRGGPRALRSAGSASPPRLSKVPSSPRWKRSWRRGQSRTAGRISGGRSPGSIP